VWHDPAANRFKWAPWLGHLMEQVERAVEAAHRVYDTMLKWALSNRWKVVGIAVLVFISSLFIATQVGTEFFPEADQGFASLRLNTPLGSSLEYTNAKVLQVEDALAQFPEIAIRDTNVGTDDGKNYARINLKLVPRNQRSRSQKELEKAIRARIREIAGVEVSVGFGKPIFISILGPDAAKISQIAQDLMEQMKQIKGIADVENSERGANPTIAVKVNEAAASDVGLTTQQIGKALRPLVAGDVISHWQASDGQDYDVLVRLSKSDRQVAADLGNLTMTTGKLRPDGSPQVVPLRQVAELVPTFTQQQVKRLNLQRRVSLYANAEGRASGDVGKDVEALFKKAQPDWPPGYRYQIGGATEDMNDAGAAALAAIGMAIIFIYLILASQFASFAQPFAIMASLPLSLIGVFLALLVTGTTLNLFSIIGLIMLMGLVTKNAILLVDFTNQGLREGKPLHQAILDAGQVRLRPILMTTLAMIFGMLPLAIGMGEGGEVQAPMGRAIIGGVITSTLLTLIVVPVIYTFAYWIGNKVGSWFARPAAEPAGGKPAHGFRNREE
jgi:multidrug efflux pump subunit AcrB